MYKGDIGTHLDVTVTDASTNAAVNVSSATTLEYRLRKPDGSRITRTATFVTDGTNGQLRYTTIAGDIDQEGAWMLQAKVVYAAGTFFSAKVAFTVHDNL